VRRVAVQDHRQDGQCEEDEREEDQHGVE
jgi:hypothetical protein